MPNAFLKDKKSARLCAMLLINILFMDSPP
jgi:hypothetical protein